jgi:MFS transporter, DHA2 family, methylenomycin A resistance protein
MSSTTHATHLPTLKGLHKRRPDGRPRSTQPGDDTGHPAAPEPTNRGRLWSLALVAVCLGYFMVILDTTIVNVAVPAVRAGLHTDTADLEWVIDGYLLMLAALVLSGGALADRIGAHRVFQIGLGVFTAASVICGVAPSVIVLVIARLIQGAGAAMSVPASLALLRAAFPDAQLRARAIGVWGAIAGVAAASGPILGGLLVTAGSWRLVFFVNVPIGLAAMVLTARHVPAPEPRKRTLQPAAQTIGVLALAALTAALIEGGASGLTPLVAAAAGVFLVATAAFITIERRSTDPLLPLTLFSDRSFAAGNAIGLLINLGFYGELFVLNLYLQQVLGYSALVAGIALLPQMGVVTFGSALSGRFTARIGNPRPALLIGLTIGGAGLLGLLVTSAHTPYVLLVGPLVAAGFGMSFTMPAATTAVIDGTPVDRSGLASGAINAARQLGGVIGIAVLGALIAGSGAGFIGGLHIAVIVAGMAFWLGGAIAAIAVRDTRRHRQTGQSERRDAPPRLNVTSPCCALPAQTGTPPLAQGTAPRH